MINAVSQSYSQVVRRLLSPAQLKRQAPTEGSLRGVQMTSLLVNEWLFPEHTTTQKALPLTSLFETSAHHKWHSQDTKLRAQWLTKVSLFVNRRTVNILRMGLFDTSAKSLLVCTLICSLSPSQGRWNRSGRSGGCRTNILVVLPSY